MPCCICGQEGLSYREYMNATAWTICEDCRTRRDVTQHLTEQEEYREPDPCDVAEREADEYVAAAI